MTVLRRVAALGLLFAALGGCTGKGAPTATVLYFDEREGDSPAWPTRMLITAAYLRIDSGPESDGFILLDRAKRLVYSVHHGERSVLEIAPLPVTLAPPPRFEHAVQTDPESYPPIGDYPVRRYTLTTNGAACVEVFAAEGLLPDAVAALREYHETLAGEHALTSAAMPADLRTDCDLADEVFRPARYLAHGFPVRQRSILGRTRELTDFQANAEVPAGLFDLPADYRRMRTAAMRDGK